MLQQISQLFRSFFDAEDKRSNARHMKIVFNLFVQGVEPLQAREFIMDYTQFSDFPDMNDRFQQLLQRVKQAHADLRHPACGPPKGYNSNTPDKARDQNRQPPAEPREPI